MLMSAVPESSGLPSACAAYEEAPAGVLITRGEESEERGDSALLRECAAEGPLHFSMFWGSLKINVKMLPNKCSTWSPKGTPKVSQHHQNGFQKASQNGVPTKKQKMMIFSNPFRRPC